MRLMRTTTKKQVLPNSARERPRHSGPKASSVAEEQRMFATTDDRFLRVFLIFASLFSFFLLGQAPLLKNCQEATSIEITFCTRQSKIKVLLTASKAASCREYSLTWLLDLVIGPIPAAAAPGAAGICTATPARRDRGKRGGLESTLAEEFKTRGWARAEASYV